MRIVSIVLFAAALAGCSSISTAPSIPAGQPSGTHASPLVGDEVLYSFAGHASGGAPQAGLVLHNGLLYGTTSSYGKGYGTVFSIDSFGKLRTVYAFNGYPDGQYPEAGVVWFDNAFYGTTSAGGLHQGGTIFSVTFDGAERVVHSFGGGRGDGAVPLAGLVNVKGVLYGTTQLGGSHDKGTVFELRSSGERVLHSFAGAPTDGGHPTAGLIRYKNALYGTTRAGGRVADGGTVYEITPFGEERVLHSFGVKVNDGQNPAAPLVEFNGEFFGTTLRGGRSRDGTVFAMSPSGSEQVLHAFLGGSDGAFPLAGLLALNGELYGTTMSGGEPERSSGVCLSGPGASGSTCGTIFRVDGFGREKVIYRFTGDPDGANPEAGLTDVGGALYGTTTWGGDHIHFGTVFRTLP